MVIVASSFVDMVARGCGSGGKMCSGPCVCSSLGSGVDTK